MAGGLVGLDHEVAVGCAVLDGSRGGSVPIGTWYVGVGVGVRFTTGVDVFLGSFVAVLSPGSVAPGVELPGKVPDQGSVGVGEGISGVTNAI